MTVRKVGTTNDTPIKMTFMPGGSRITGTFGSGSPNGVTCWNVPVTLTDGEPSIYRKKFALGQCFFKPRGAMDGLFIFRGYDPDAPH